MRRSGVPHTRHAAARGRHAATARMRGGAKTRASPSNGCGQAPRGDDQRVQRSETIKARQTAAAWRQQACATKARIGGIFARNYDTNVSNPRPAGYIK